MESKETTIEVSKGTTSETKTLTIVNEVQVPKKETGWMKFWQKIDGNKTLILSMIALTVSLCPIPEPIKGIILGVLGLAGAKTGYDHVQKGGFKRSVQGVKIEK